MTKTFSMFDRVVDIELVRPSGKVEKILCPRTGRKPFIEVSGELRANTIQNGLLKITNYYPKTPLNFDSSDGVVYSWLRIRAGYASGLMTTLEGQSLMAYTDQPGPDGVSVITFFTGPMTVWNKVPITKGWPTGTSINSIVSDLCETLKKGTTLEINLKSYISNSVVVKAPGLSVTGTASNLTEKLKDAYGIYVYPAGTDMIVCDQYEGTSEEYTLKYVTSIKKTGAGYTIIAPWVPAIRQNDTVVIDAKFFTVENYGGIGANFTNKFTVISSVYTFATVGDTNTMTLLCVGKRA